MNFFDLRTAYLITGMLYFIMPAAIWLALRENRTRSVNEWCAGGAFFGLALLLLSLRNHLPNWLTFEVTAVMLNFAQMLRVMALRRELKRPLGGGTPVILLGIFYVLYEMGRWLEGPRPLYYLVALTFLAAYFLWIAVLAHELASQEKLQSARWLGLTYIPLSFLLALHALRMGSGQGLAGPLQSDWGTVAIVLMGSVTAAMGNASFMGIFVERATRQQLEMTKEQVRAAEIARLGHQIARLERARGMGMITASVVHELSQPLGSILLTAEQAEFESKSHPSDTTVIGRHIDNILVPCRHAVEVLNRIRNFITHNDAPHQPISLQEVYKQVMGLLQHLLKSEDVQVFFTASDEPVTVMGDGVQLAQVLLNLLRNSIEATSGRSSRRITVSIERQRGLACIAVRDNGPGFSSEALRRSGEGYFSSKSEGMGLGLLISQQIAASHQGHLKVGNDPRAGAVVELVLPALS